MSWNWLYQYMHSGLKFCCCTTSKQAVCKLMEKHPRGRRAPRKQLMLYLQLFRMLMTYLPFSYRVVFARGRSGKQLNRCCEMGEYRVVFQSFLCIKISPTFAGMSVGRTMRPCFLMNLQTQ